MGNSQVGNLFGWNREGSGIINQVVKLNKYKILHLFGDTDAACSLTAMRKWFKSLKWPVTKAWEPWLYKDEFIGYRKEYDNYAFITMFGMGHGGMFLKPEAVQDIVLRFLASKGSNY